MQALTASWLLRGFNDQPVPILLIRPRCLVATAASFGIALSTLLVGGMSTSCTPPPTEHAGSGWSASSALAPVADVDADAEGMPRALSSHRLPFDAAMADAALSSVAPVRIRPGPRCQRETPRGIAVLVHGLSDTARVMRDLAVSFSRQWFGSRVLLRPAHRTRPDDLMRVDHRDWLAHVQAAVLQLAADDRRERACPRASPSRCPAGSAA